MFEALLLKGKDFFLRMIDIRMGEFRRVWLMQLNVFLLLQSLWIIKPIVTAQFLSRVGIDKLPLVFLLVAVCALVVSKSYSRLLSRLPIGSIMLRTYLISILCLLTFSVLLQIGQFQDWMSYLFYIGVALFGLITTSQFWLLGNLVFSSLEAKRVFGFIGAGAIAGGITGGYVTSVLAPMMDSKNLLLVAAVLLIINMLVNHRIWITFVPSVIRSVNNRQPKTQHEYPFRLIRNSKHLTYLALIIGISVVIAKLVEFQFSAIASDRIKDPDQLSAYFGFWFSTSNVVSLGIQLFVTQRILARIGVGRSLFILPGALFAGAATVLYTPVLWAGTTLKLFDISLKQSINKAATELLIVPIPLAIKTQAKTFIDIFVDTTATGIGGIMLIFLINGFDLSVRAVSIMILALICLWIYFAVRVRREYVLSFEGKLGIGKHTPSKKDFSNSHTPVVKGIRRTLETGSVKQILFLLARIEEGKDARLMPNTIPLLKHESPLVREAALRCLYYHTDHTITAQIEPLLRDPDDEVRSRAFSSLLAQTRQNRVAFINEYLQDDDPAISGAALVGLATEACDNPVMQQTFNLVERVQQKINVIPHIHDPEELTAHKIMIARAISYGKLSIFYPVLLEFLKDKDPDVLKQAIISSGKSLYPDFIKPLLTFLPARVTRPAAKKALGHFEPAEMLPILTEVSSSKHVNHDLLIQLPSLARTMDTPQAVDFLLGLAQHDDAGAKQEALEALHDLKARFPHLQISVKRIIPILMQEVGVYREALAIIYAEKRSLTKQKDESKIKAARIELIELLQQRSGNILERIFWLLSLLYPNGTILSLLKDFRSPDHQVRMNSVELLDNILEPSLKKVIIPILETTMLDTVTREDIHRLGHEVPKENIYFESLLKGDDDLIKLAVLALIEVLDHPDLDHVLTVASKDEHGRVRSYAEKILNKE